MHYFQFNIGDYASHTSHLTPIEDLAYRRLLDLAYTTELPLTKDVRALSRRINLRDYEQEITDVLSEFFYQLEDGWVNNRVIKEIEKTGTRSEKARNSAARRWEKERKSCEVDANAMLDECERNANASNIDANACNTGVKPMLPITHNTLPITHNPIHITQDQKPKRQKASLALTRFADFWTVYPKRSDRSKAEQLWSKRGLDAIADLVIEGAMAYATAKTGSDPKYIALPTTWLNGKRWLDEPDKPYSPPATGQVLGIADRVMQNYERNQAKARQIGKELPLHSHETENTGTDSQKLLTLNTSDSVRFV